MAIVSMQKVLISGALEEESALLKELQRCGTLHLKELSAEQLNTPEIREALSKAEKQAQTAENALKVLNEYAPPEGGLLSSLKGGKELAYSDWLEKSKSDGSALRLAEGLLEKQRSIGEFTARAARSQVLMEGLVPWKGLTLPLNMSGTAATRVLIGALPGLWTEEAIRTLLAENLPELDAYDLELLQADATQTPLVLICLKEDFPQIEELLRKKGFARPILTSDKTPDEVLKDLAFERAAAVTEAEETKAAIRALAGEREKLQFLADDSRLEASRLAALGKAGEGSRSFFLSGFVPAAKAETLKNSWKKNSRSVWIFWKKKRKKTPPSCLKTVHSARRRNPSWNPTACLPGARSIRPRSCPSSTISCSV